MKKNTVREMITKNIRPTIVMAAIMAALYASAPVLYASVDIMTTVV